MIHRAGRHSPRARQTVTSSPCLSPSSMATEQSRPTVVFVTVAVIMDVVGLVIFLVGCIAPISFWDFFVISGPVLIFLSLVFWIFWYLGNLTVPEEELNLIGKTNVL